MRRNAKIVCKRVFRRSGFADAGGLRSARISRRQPDCRRN
jgi:hypothetical protein